MKKKCPAATYKEYSIKTDGVVTEAAQQVASETLNLFPQLTSSTNDPIGSSLFHKKALPVMKITSKREKRHLLAERNIPPLSSTVNWPFVGVS